MSTLALVVAAVVLHEAGHALAAQVLGLRWKIYMRFPVSLGIAAEPSRRVAAAGPLVSLVAGLIAFGAGWYMFSAASLILGLVSLVPVRPQDGWRMIHR